MALFKCVNGVSVQCSPEEEAGLLAEWSANDPAKLPPPQPTLSVADLANALKAKNVITEADLTAAVTVTTSATATV